MRAKWITRLLIAAVCVYPLGFPTLLVWLSGGWRWARGWTFYASLALCGGAIMVWLYLHDPGLLAERVRRPGTGGESRSDAAIVVSAKAGFLAWLVLPALDRRFGWMPQIPLWIGVCGGALLAAGYFFIVRAMTDNSFASQLVRIQAERGHYVVDTGTYSFVRHPMYLGGALMLVGGSLLLGSIPGLAAGLAVALLLVVRIFGEEDVLLNGLEGYEAYRKKVRYRLIPGVW